MANGVTYTEIEGLDFGFIGKVETLKESKDLKSTLEKYEGYQQDKVLFDITFSGILGGSQLFVDDNGVRVILDAGDVVKGAAGGKNAGLSLLKEAYHVRVREVDREKNVVYVTYRSAKASARKKFVDAIEDSLANKKEIKLPARVTFVNVASRRVLVDIGGVGVRGSIGLADWSNVFTTSFAGIVEVGDIIPVVVTGKTRVKGVTVYACSRKKAVPEVSWKGIEERYPVDTPVVIKCTGLRPKSFFGTIEGLKDIEVFCEYPPKKVDAQGNELIIDVGCTYQGIIYRVSEEKKNLKARILYKIK